MEGLFSRNANSEMAHTPSTSANLSMRALMVAVILFGAVLSSSIRANALAKVESGDDQEMQGYEAIVNQLNREADRGAAMIKQKNVVRASTDPFDSIWLHFGVGMANLMQTLNFDDGSQAFLGNKGVQIASGIDLFSPNWAAEGTYRGFAESEDSAARVALQEFELKLFYKNRLSRQLGFRGGAGLSGRYMSIRRFGRPDVLNTTPSSVATAGLDLFMNDNISVGTDLSVRSAMISDTLDRVSYDATLRLDTHF